MTSDCRVSFVVTSRNDDHGGDMLERCGVFTDGLLEQANRHGVAGELIVVDWNPPAGPRLHEALKIRKTSDVFAVRFIEVPPAAHQAIRNSDTIPLFQMIAKNVGIRRAHGEFVIATNPDLLFSDEVMSFLATGDLRPDTMYRLDRQDVANGVPAHASVAEQLAWCATHVLRVHGRGGSVEDPTLAQQQDRGRHTLIRRFRKAMALAYALFGPRRVVRHTVWLVLKHLLASPGVHTNGCGDFTMLSRARWCELRGYPELPLWSMHLDALLCLMAVASGVREQVLGPPCAMFHLEHGHSWVVMTPEQRLRTFAVKPWIDTWLLGDLWEDAYSTGRPIVFNDERWGLGDHCLQEVRIVSGDRHTVQEGTSVTSGGGGAR
jgi:hypothetical protein